MTDTQKPTPGWYDAYAEGASLHSGDQTLGVNIRYRIVEGGFPMTKYHNIVKKDGTFNARTDRFTGKEITERETLERRYGWDFSDLEHFSVGEMNPEIIVRVLIKDGEWNGKPRLEIGYVADKNDDGERAAPDPKAIAAKFGQMMRATAQKINRPASKPAAPASPAKKAAPPTKPSGVSNQQECWELFCSTSKEADEAKRTENWFALLERVNPGIQQDDFASQEWFNVACEIRKHMGKEEIPF